jgi:hypothetical protein
MLTELCLIFEKAGIATWLFAAVGKFIEEDGIVVGMVARKISILSLQDCDTMNKIPNRFRPSSAMTTQRIMRERRRHGAVLGSYNWQSRAEWYPAGFQLNRKTIFRQFGRLHYLACHSPERVQRQWQKVYDNFHTKHFGTFKGSMRYLNQWSCHAWL